MRQKGESSLVQFLWNSIRRERMRFLLALVGLMSVSMASLVYPWLIKMMVDRVTGRAAEDVHIDTLCLILLGIFSASSLIGYFQQREMKILGFKVRNAARTSLYASLLARPMSFHQTARVGELTSRASEDLSKLQVAFSGILSPAVQNALFVVGCIILMAMLNWAAALLVIGLVALPIPLLYVLSAKIREGSARTQAGHATANAFLSESLVAVREIKSFVREKLEVARYGRLLDRALVTEDRVTALQVKLDQAVYLLFSVVLLGIFYAGTRHTFLPAWSIGDVIAFYFYSYTMSMALLSVGRTYLAMQEISGAWERVGELLSIEDEAADPDAAATPVVGGIEFRRVAFSYDLNRPLLNNLSFSLEPGRWLLVTGTSGSGKSTMASLLMGFLQPGAGCILVDGVPVANRDTQSLRRQIGYVGQDPMLLYGTLEENILFRGVPVTEDQFSRAIRVACLADLIDTLPDGLETLVGERGYKLSSGQKARIAVARAIIHDPPILILDEANATLDPALERQLWSNLAENRARKTTIIFSHHFQNIPDACQVVRLCEGSLLPLTREVQR